MKQLKRCCEDCTDVVINIKKAVTKNFCNNKECPCHDPSLSENTITVTKGQSVSETQEGEKVALYN